MTNPTIDAYLDEVGQHLEGLGKRRRAALLEEMRGHLEEDVLRRRAEDPALSLEDASLRATHDFGEPVEIGRRRSGASPPPRPWSPRAWSKGARWLAAAVVLLLACGLVAVIIVGTVTGGFHAPDTLYTRSIEYRGQSGWENNTFDAGDTYGTIGLDLVLRNTDANGTGCLTVTVLDESGHPVFDSGDSCAMLDQRLTLHGDGTWQIHYRFTRFTGTVDVAVRKA